MNKQKAVELVFLGRRAQRERVYRVANVVFAILIASLLEEEEGTTNEESGLFVMWATDDPDGEYLSQAEYDLGEVCVSGETGAYLRIPAPLLHPATAVALLKRAVASGGVEEKGGGGGMYQPPSPNKRRRLWKELARVSQLSLEEVEEVIHLHLSAFPGEDGEKDRALMREAFSLGEAEIDE